jgi:hypothetical protein
MGGMHPPPFSLFHRHFDWLFKEPWPSAHFQVDHQRPTTGLEADRYFERNHSLGLLDDANLHVLRTVRQVQFVHDALTERLARSAHHIADLCCAWVHAGDMRSLRCRRQRRQVQDGQDQ